MSDAAFYRAVRCERCRVVLHRGDVSQRCDCPTADRMISLSAFGHVYTGPESRWSGVSEE